MLKQLTSLFTRTRAEPEDTDEDELCPPHEFHSGWGSPAGSDVPEPQCVPVIFCEACGDIRPLRIPADLKP